MRHSLQNASVSPSSMTLGTPDGESWTRSRTVEQQQRLRLLRFAAASATYGIGLCVLVACAALGLLSWPHLLVLAATILLPNLIFLALFLSRANLRFREPSLTLAQVLTGVGIISLMLLSGAQMNLLAVPFYSVLFVFAMLRLDRRGLFQVGVCILLSYAAALALRLRWYAGMVPPSTEMLTALLVLVSTLWFASAASYIARLRQRLKETASKLEHMATRDALTGLWNRRQIEALLQREIQRALRSGAPLAILLADIDHFKSINDRFGHPTGDAILRQVGQLIGGSLRAGGEVGRWGGEEFLLVLPDTSLGDALACASRLRETLESTAFEHLPEPCAVSASIGLAAWSAAEPLSTLLSRADRAMYQAKQAGRNRVGIDELI